MIIKPSRQIPWIPGVYQGVVGGIPGSPGGPPARAVYTTLTPRPGTEDNQPQILAALNACPPNQKVLLGPGTFRVFNEILLSTQNNKTLCGSGPRVTIIKAFAQPIHLGASDDPRPVANINITAGATKGSTSVTCDDVSTVTVGKLMRIEQTNPTWVKPLNNGTLNGSDMSVMVRVTAKVGNVVSFTGHPLPFDYPNSPKAVVYMSDFGYGPIIGFGVEDLTIDCLNASFFAGIYVETAYGCWIKNVEIKGAISRQVALYYSINCEIRRCYFHDGRGGGPNSEGLDLVQDDCWNLIEDNIISAGGYPQIVLGDAFGGCSGNIIAYNYLANTLSGNQLAGISISTNHGPHNMMNLIEGNVGQSLESDGYKGSSSHQTVFRNWFSGKFPAPDNGFERAIALKHYANYYNIVGNVLGYPGSTVAYDIEVNGYNGYGANSVVYQLGYPNSGNSGWSTQPPAPIAITDPPDYTGQPVSIDPLLPQRFDPNVKVNLARHGNFIYATGRNAIEWEINNNNVEDFNDTVIPDSLYLTSRTATGMVWGTLTYPPIDPTNPAASTGVDRIPAHYRYTHGGYDPGVYIPPGTWEPPVDLLSGPYDAGMYSTGYTAVVIKSTDDIIYVRRSSDEGATFDLSEAQGAGRIYLEHPIAGKGPIFGIASVTVTETVSTVLGARPVGPIYVRRSLNEGDTWSSPILATSGTGRRAFRLSLVISEGIWHLVWMNYTSSTPDGTWNIEYVRSLTNGLTWPTPPVIIAAGTNTMGAHRPSIAVSGANLFVVAMDARDNLGPCDIEGGTTLPICTEVYLTKSNNYGAPGSWAVPRRLTFDVPYSGRPDIAMVGLNIVIVYDHKVTGTNVDVGMLVSTDGGANFTQSLLVSAAGDQTHAGIAGSAQHGFHSAWQDSRGGSPRIFYKWSQDLVTWSADQQISFGGNVSAPAMGLTENYFHVSWGDVNLKHARRFLGVGEIPPSGAFILPKI